MLSLLVLCAASLLVVVVDELCASAGFAGVVACAIICGVVELLLSDCGVVLVFGVALLSGVVVVVVLECCVVVVLVALASGVLEALPLLPYASVAGLAQGWSAWLLPLVGFALLQGVALLVQGVVCVPPLAFGESLCGVAGVTLEPVEDDESMLLPLVLLGVALSWVLDGVAGVEGEVVVVVVDCFVVLLADWPFMSVLVELCALDGLLVVSVLVLCASASVPVRSRPAARIDIFFM